MNETSPPADRPATRIKAIAVDGWPAVAARLGQADRALAQATAFTGAAGQLVIAPGDEGAPGSVFFGIGEGRDAMVFRGLAARVPSGAYALEEVPQGLRADAIALAWSLGGYRFERYRRLKADAVGVLAMPPGADTHGVAAADAACHLVRDMINTPAADMGPAEVEAIARDVAAAHGAGLVVTGAEDLISAGYPAVHAVGRAAIPARGPRMIEMTWGEAERPHMVIVGKGVVFDTGGLDIKPSASMRAMKKDMGGAAHALGLASMIMEASLAVRLSVLIPVVENAISGDAMRPGDVLASRKGLTIEVGNTDAEGRLILADALTRAGELAPDLTLDLATLTGAARVALGPDVVPFYTDDAALAAELSAASETEEDPLWRMPLWSGYESAIDSDIADVCNDADPWAQAGSVTAALFLRRFAPAGAWAHFDIFAWNPRARPGWPRGAEVQAIRAIFAVLKARYA